MSWEQKIKELQIYQGCSQIEPDMEKFWQEGLEELEGIDPEIMMIPSSIKFDNFDCVDVFFTSINQGRIHGKLVVPNVSEKSRIPGIVKFHGYGHYSGDWQEQLGLASTGSAVFSIDCRGQSGTSVDVIQTKGTTFKGHLIRGIQEGEKNLLYRSIFLDTVQAVRVMMSLENIDQDKISSFGYSQGGGLALACAALEPRIKKVAVAYPFLSDYQGVYESGILSDAYEEITKYIKDYDPLHQQKAEIFRRLSYIDIQHLMPWVKAEVLFAASLSDTTCPPFAQFAAFNKLNTKKEIRLYPDFGHENLPGYMDQVTMFLQGGN